MLLTGGQRWKRAPRLAALGLVYAASACKGPKSASSGEATATASATATEAATGTATTTGTATDAPPPPPAPYVDPDDLVESEPPFPADRALTYAAGCVVTGGADADGWPATLAATGCFADLAARKLADGILTYEVKVPFFSAGAGKERGLALPAGGRIGFAKDEPWDLPVGTRVLKTFTLGGKPVETRILRKDADGLKGAVYEWNDAGTDAALRDPAAADVAKQPLVWHLPSREECGKCHTPAAGGYLGFRTVQMNARHDLAGLGFAYNQIEALAQLGAFTAAPAEKGKDLPRLTDPTAAAADLTARARSYLEANCAYCHMPGSSGNADFDARVALPLASTKLCGADDMQGDLGVPDAKLLAPGLPEKSLLVLRLRSDRSTRMPPIGPDAVDDAGAALLHDWIETAVTSCP